MSERVRLPVDAVVVQHVVPRLLWLRWPLCVALTPTLACAFLWAGLVWLVLRFFAWLGDPRRALRAAGLPGVLKVKDGVLRVRAGGGTKITVRREDLRDGWIEPGQDETYVLLRLRDGRRIVARVRDLAAARRLLHEAGVDVGRRLLEVPLGSKAKAEGNGTVMHLLGPFLAGIFLFSGLGALNAGQLGFGGVVTTVSVACMVALLRYIAPGRAIVGADGVRVVRLFGSTFVPYEKIRGVNKASNGVTIELEGARLRLCTETFVDDSPGRREALAARLEEAIRTFQAERLDEEARRAFAREGRTVAAWREELARLSRGGDYRRIVLETEDVIRVVEDPAGPAERRVGAALALAGRELSPELRDRVGAAVAASANPRLRIALDKALAGELDDEDLEGLAPEARRRTTA